METLFGNLFTFSNKAFEVNNAVDTEAHCKVAYTRLQNETKSLIKVAVKDAVNEEIKDLFAGI